MNTDERMLSGTDFSGRLTRPTSPVTFSRPVKPIIAIGSATTWKAGWQRNNYVNSQRKIVANLEIIQLLHRLIDARTAPVTFTKVKGHDLSNRWPLNTAVDQVCGRAALATQESGSTVHDSGVMQIDWEPRVLRPGTLA